MSMTHRRRPLWWLLAPFSALVVAAIVLALSDRDQVLHPETGYLFPTLSDIVKLEAIEITDYATGEVSSFEVPKSHWEGVLGALSPSEQDLTAKKMEVFGRLKLDATDKPAVVVVLYRMPGNVGEFSTGSDGRSAFHNYYRGGNSKQLELALKKAYSESQRLNPETHEPEADPTPN